MKKLFLVIFTVLFCLISNVGWTASWKDTVCKYTGFTCPEIPEIDDFEELVILDGHYYKKFTDTPFTGKVTGGAKQGSFKNGKKEGYWVEYYENGQIRSKGNYKDGEYDGLWEGYLENGQLDYKGNYKGGEVVGLVEWFYNGRLVEKGEKGNRKDDSRDGFWEEYHWNGQLEGKGNYKDGRRKWTVIF